MNKIWKFLCGAVCAFAFCSLAIGYAAIQDELRVTGSVSVQVDHYNVIYHTYDADGNNVIYKTDTYYSSSDTVTISECPSDKVKSDFYGWTFSGVYTPSFTSNIAVYTGGETVAFSTLQSNQGTTGKEVHLYDVYTTSPTLTAVQHPLDKVVGPVSSNAQTPFTFKSKVPSGKEFEVKTSGNAAVNFVSKTDGKTVVLYYHPGVQVMVNSDTSLGGTAYVTKNNTDKTSKVTSYEALPVSGNTVRYVGLDKVVSDAYVIYYHTYNDTQGDFVLGYETYFGKSTAITVRARPSASENSFVSSKSWRGWTLTGLVYSDGSDDNVTEYQQGNTPTISTLLSQQFDDGYVCKDEEGNNCIRFFDVYADTAKVVGTTHPSDTTVSSSLPTMFKVSPAYYFNDSSDPYRRFTFERPDDNSWNITSVGDSYTFYYHPGIQLLGQTNGDHDDGRVFMTLNSSSAYYDESKSWTNPDENGKEGRGIIHTDLNNLRIESSNDQGVTLAWNGTITVYDVDTKTSSGGDCFAPGTLITLADGSCVPVEDLTGDEMLLAFDHETGQYVPAKLLIAQNRGEKLWSTMDLEFSDGTTLTIMNERALFDITLNRYVWINKNNLTDFIGHEFAKQTENGDGFIHVTLVNASEEERYTTCYSVVSIYHFNCFGNGMMSLPGSVEGLFNYFEYDEGLKYDEAKKQADIEKYGLFEAKDFEGELDEVLFEQMFPVKYMKIAIGKGNITREEILQIIAIWVDGENLLERFPAK